jgi:hypothetical protein
VLAPDGTPAPWPEADAPAGGTRPRPASAGRARRRRSRTRSSRRASGAGPRRNPGSPGSTGTHPWAWSRSGDARRPDRRWWRRGPCPETSALGATIHASRRFGRSGRHVRPRPALRRPFCSCIVPVQRAIPTPHAPHQPPPARHARPIGPARPQAPRLARAPPFSQARPGAAPPRAAAIPRFLRNRPARTTRTTAPARFRPKPPRCASATTILRNCPTPLPGTRAIRPHRARATPRPAFVRNDIARRVKGPKQPKQPTPPRRLTAATAPRRGPPAARPCAAARLP